jgi:filamentous hemagglutinin
MSAVSLLLALITGATFNAQSAVTLRGVALDNSAGYVEAGTTLTVPFDTTLAVPSDTAATTRINDIDLRSAQNTVTQTSTNKSSSASIGVGFAVGGAQNGFTINAAASQARGNSDGTDVTNTLSTVSAGNGLTLKSGRDTTLIGATASGKQVTVDVGGNLDIQSVQDTSTFTSKESSAGVGVSICAPPICYGASSGSVSASKGKVNGEFASVATQSGLQAGDGGFNINVNGNTNLKGAAITSSQTAVDQNKNSFSTDTITQSEIENKDNYSASSLALSASYSTAAKEYNPDTDQAQTARNSDGSLKQASNSQGLGVGSVSGNEHSTTGNAISGATVTIRSGDDKALDGIDRTAVTETSNANALTKHWDGQKLGQDTRLQAQLVQSVGQSAAKEIGDYFGQQADSLKAQAAAADKAGDKVLAKQLSDEAAKWDEGGLYRVAAHTSVGLLLGGADGALGAGAAAQAAPLITDLQSGVQKSLQDAGMSPDAAKAVATVIGTGTATVIGAAAGGGNITSAATAFNVDANNRQLHPSELKRLQELAGGDPKKLERLQAAACALVHCADGVSTSDPNYASLKRLQDSGAEYTSEQALLSQQVSRPGDPTRSFGTPLFTYGMVDTTKDWSSQNNMGTRLAGAAQGTLGILGVSASAGACTTGLLCGLAAIGGTVSADYAVAGISQAATGRSTTPYGEQVLQSLGLNPTAASVTYGVIGLAPAGPAAVEAVVGARAGRGPNAAETAVIPRAEAETNSGAANVAAHETYKDVLRAEMSRPEVSDPILSRYLDELYRPNATVGSGSTAAAVRQELATGQPVGGVFHFEKAENSVKALERWLTNNSTASSIDRAAAENIIRDLQNALRGK